MLKLRRILHRKRNSSPSKWRKSFAIIAGLVLLAAGPTAYILLKNPSNAQAAWFDNSWAFRQKVPITNTTGTTQTGFQVQLSIDTATLITAGKLQSSCQDVRITNNAGKQLPFWIEPNTCNTSATKVWAKVDTIPTASSGTSADIYFYYGNSATAAANYTASNVFVRDLTGDSAVWPLDDTTTTQSYSNVNNPAVATGRNIIINGTFDDTSAWVTGVNWAITGGVATATGATTDNMRQAVLTVGKTYKITYTISGYVSGGINAKAGSAGFVGTTNSANGTYTDTLVAAGDTYLRIAPVTSFTGSIDNVTVSQVNIPASGSTNTQLMTDGDMETAGVAAWTVGNSATLTKQTGTPHGGSQVLRIARNGVNSPYAHQAITTLGQTYRMTGYARSDGGAVPNVTNFTTQVWQGSISTAWQPFDITFVATYAPGNVALQCVTSTGTQYCEFDDVVLSLDTGLRTGEISQDGGFESWNNASTPTYWSAFTAGSSTVNREASVIHSGSFAVRFDVDASNNSAILQQLNTLVPGKTYTASFWAKADTAGPTVALTTGAGGASYIAPTLTTTYTQYLVTFVAQDNGVELKRSSAASHSIYLDDLTITEVDPLVGIPTNGVTLGSTSAGHLTNAYTFDGTNDFVNLYSTDLNSAFSPNEGTFVAWAKVSSSGVWTDGTQDYLMILQADASNQIYIRKQTTSNQLTFDYSSSGTNKTITNTSAPTGWFQVAFTWSKSTDQVIAYMNGVQTGTTQTGMGTWAGNLSTTASILGAASTAANVPWNGMMNDVHLYSRALDASEISALYGNGTIDRQAYYTNNYSGHELIRQYNTSVTVGSFATEEVGVNPAGYWKFDEGTGQAAKDSSTRRIDGTLGATSSSASDDPTWATEDQCVSGKCLKFDGTNDMVNVGDVAAARLGNTGTAETWVKPNAYPGASSWAVILNKGSWGSGRNLYAIYYQNSSSFLRFDLGGSSANNAITVPNTLTPLNTWSHVALTWDGTTVRAYVNGKQVGTATQTQTPDTSTWPLQFGAASASQFLNGFIDEPKIFSYARTAAQIQVDYSAGASSIGSQSTSALTNGLVGYWKLDEVSGAGATLADSSGNNNTGTAKLFGGGNTSTDSAHVAGKFGNGFSFDGGDDNIDIPYSSNLTGAGSVSLSAWIKPTTIGGADYVFGNTSQSFRFLLSGTTNIQFPTACGSLTGFSTPMQTGVWQLLTGTFDSTTGQTVIYLNGAKVSSGICTGAILDAANLSIGGTSTRRFNGSIDEMRMYNRALSPAEVQQLYNFAPGPVGWWKMDEKTGISANDISGNGNVGTLTCSGGGCLVPSWSNGKYGSSLLFDGTNQYLNVPDAASGILDPLYAYSISTWVKFTSTTNYGFIVSKSNGGSGGYELFRDTGTGAIRFSSCSGVGVCSGGYFDITTTASYNDGTWHHIEATAANGDTAKIYIDGILVKTSSTISQNNVDTTDPLSIGSRGNHGSTIRFVGSIDDVKLYNYARSATQVQEDMRGGLTTNGEISTVAGAANQTKPASPFSYWKFDEGYGTLANNAGSGGSVLNAALANMASPATSTSGWTSSGKVNKGLVFDGTNDAVNIYSSGMNSAFNGSEGSASFWLKPSSSGIWTDSTARYPLYLYADANNNIYVAKLTTNNTLQFYYSAGGTVKTVNTTVLGGTTAWSHVILTWSKSADQMKVFINGQQIGTTQTGLGTWAGSLDTTHNTIGATNTAGSNPWSGSIDEVKLYNFALTQDQVNSDFNQNLTQNFGVTETKEAANDLTDGAGNDPVASWGFDEKTGTTANDSSGHGNTGTLTNGPTWTQGKNAQAIKFDGVDDYVNVPSATNMTPATSISFGAWIKSNPNGIYGSGSNAGIIAKKSSWGGLWIPTNGGLITARITNSSAVSVTNGITTLIPGAWTHVFVVADASTSTIYYYINGRVFTTAAYNGTLQVGTDALTIGQQAGEYFNGTIDDVKIYDYARTASQVAYDYNRGAPVAWWKMDECQGTTLNDSSGNGSIGTIITPATGTQTQAGTCNTAGTAWGNGATGKYNASVNFDGSDDYATVPNPSVDDFGTGPMSVSVWVKTTSTAIAQIIDNKTAGSNAAGFNLGVNLIAGNGRVMWRVANGTTQTSTGTTTDASIVNDGNWHHLVGVYARGTTNDTLLLYKDGKLAQSNTLVTAGWNISTSANMLIGAFLTSAGSGNFPGQIDDIRLFNYALSQNQVNKLYNENTSVLYGPATGSP